MSRVDVIVPCYNYARFLPEALESVLAQTHQDWECIVVDDGSTDDTYEVARRFGERDARIRAVRQDNAGPAAARNHALRLGSGEYVQLLDADDKLADVRAVEEHVDRRRQLLEALDDGLERSQLALRHQSGDLADRFWGSAEVVENDEALQRGPLGE